MASTSPFISNSFIPGTNPLVTVPRAPITIGSSATFMLNSCFFFYSVVSQGRGIYLSFRFLSILLYGQPEQQSLQFDKFSFFLLTITRSGRLAYIQWSVYISKSQKSLLLSFFRKKFDSLEIHKKLVKIDGNLNSVKYIQLWKDKLILDLNEGEIF